MVHLFKDLRYFCRFFLFFSGLHFLVLTVLGIFKILANKISSHSVADYSTEVSAGIFNHGWVNIASDYALRLIVCRNLEGKSTDVAADFKDTLALERVYLLFKLALLRHRLVTLYKLLFEELK
jgi:hypothetical protein